MQTQTVGRCQFRAVQSPKRELQGGPVTDCSPAQCQQQSALSSCLLRRAWANHPMSLLGEAGPQAVARTLGNTDRHYRSLVVTLTNGAPAGSQSASETPL